MRALPLAFSSFLLVTSAHAADATWNVNADGSWVTDSNWNPAAAPGSTSSTTNTDTATFGISLTAARIVTVDANRNIFGINFTNTSSSGYALSGGSLLLTAGGTIQNSGAGSNHTDTVAAPITLQGDYTFAANSTNNSRILAFGSAATITSAATSSTTKLTLTGTNTSNSNGIASIISNGGGSNVVAIDKTGAGTWALSGVNTFTGGVKVSAGNLRIANGAGAGASTNVITMLSGSTVTAATSFSQAITVSGANAAVTLSTTALGNSYGGLVTGSADQTINITGGAQFFNFGVANTKQLQNFLGNVSIASGHGLQFRGTISGAGNGSDNSLFTVNGTLNTHNTGNIALGALAGSGSVTGGVNTAGTTTFTIGARNTNANFSGAISDRDLTHASAVIKAGAAIQTFSGTNTYTGATTINAGTLQFAKVLSLYNNTTASWTAANIRAASGGTLAFNVGGVVEFTTTDVTTLLTNLATSTSATNGMSAGSSLAFDTTNASDSTFTIADVLADTTGATGGARGVTKLGTGSLALTNTNTYTGATTVNAGILNISSGSSLATGSAVTVQNTGSTLSGAGTVNGNINIKSGAVLAAGDSGGTAVGILTASTGSNTLTLESESIYAWGLAGSTDTDSGGVRGVDYDAVDAANVSADSNAIFRVILGTIPLANMQTPGNTFWSQTQTWSNIFSSTFSGFNSPVQVFDASGADVSNTTSPYGSFTANGSTLTWAAVPEPATSLIAGLMIGAGLLRRRNPAR